MRRYLLSLAMLPIVFGCTKTDDGSHLSPPPQSTEGLNDASDPLMTAGPVIRANAGAAFRDRTPIISSAIPIINDQGKTIRFAEVRKLRT